MKIGVQISSLKSLLTTAEQVEAAFARLARLLKARGLEVASYSGYTFEELRDMKDDFYLIPCPKFDEAQESYYNRVSTVYATCVAIPKNVRDPEMSAIITDALMQASTKTTKFAYFQTIMQDRKVQDTESEDMLQIIFDSRVYDLASIYHWGGTNEADLNSISGFMNAIAISGTNTFTSQWQAIESSVKADMEDTLDAYYNND